MTVGNYNGVFGTTVERKSGETACEVHGARWQPILLTCANSVFQSCIFQLGAIPLLQCMQFNSSKGKGAWIKEEKECAFLT